MNILSIDFALFVCLTLAVYYRTPLRHQRLVLCVASLAFYATWGWHLPVLVLLLAAIAKICGAVAGRGESASRAAGIGIISILAGMVFLRLLTHAAENLLPILSDPSRLATSDSAFVLIDVGLSFAALQAISYVVDVRQGAIPSASYLDLTIFLSFFPKVLAGPLERAGDFVPQLRQARVVGARTLSEATGLMLLGAFRKLVVAGLLMPLIAQTVSPGLPTAELIIWLFALVFFFYNDFAGYSEIARGVALLFGVRLTRNFDRPLHSRSLIELWTRWHASLSMWMRDYVYLPAARAMLRRRHRIPQWSARLVPSVAALIASGLWHVLEPRMIAWGAFVGVAIFLWPSLQRSQRASSLVSRAALWTAIPLIMLLFVRSPAQSLALVRQGGFDVPDAHRLARLILLACLSFAVDALQCKGTGEVVVLRWPRPVRAGLMAATIILCLAVAHAASPIFIYQLF